jgi:hypothetical protein
MEASDSLLLHKSAIAEVINQVFLYFSKICLLTLFVASVLCKGEKEYQANPQGMVSWS